MEVLDNVFAQMDLDFIGTAQHKIGAESLLSDCKAVLLDVRTLEEVETLALPFSHHLTCTHIPLHTLPQQFAQLPKDATLGIFCPHGVRAAMAYVYLRCQGYEQVYVMEGGYAALAEQARPGKVLAQIKK